MTTPYQIAKITAVLFVIMYTAKVVHAQNVVENTNVEAPSFTVVMGLKAIYPQKPVVITIDPESKAQAYLNNYRKGVSPLKGYVSKFFNLTSSERNAKLILAIAGAESSFGLGGEAGKYKNPFGFFCARPNKQHQLDCGFYGAKDSWDYALTRIIPSIESKYASKWDGTKEGLNKVFIGSYCTSGCQHWVNNVYSFYSQF
jgi:hypothetical protein